MGFFDAVKKGASMAKKGLEMADEVIKKKVSKMSDTELKNADQSNRYVREEMSRRGLV